MDKYSAYKYSGKADRQNIRKETADQSDIIIDTPRDTCYAA